MTRIWPLAIAASLSLTACGMPGGSGASGAQGAITVTDGGQVETKGAPIELKPDAASPYRTLDTSSDFSFTYTARVPAVTVDGRAVQADDILINGKQAFIAYNMAGPDFAGAIQVLDISDVSRPKVTKEFRFSAMDINRLAIDSNDLVFGGAANPEVYPYKSFIGRISLKTLALPTAMQPLKSHAVTAIAPHGATIYAGVGARDGGIEQLNNDFVEQRFLKYPDVRALTIFEGGALALVGTTDSTRTSAALVVAKSASTQEIPLENFDSPYAKATIEVINGNNALMALSGAGVVVKDLKSPYSTLFKLPNPSGDSRNDANSASADGDMIFVANGEYGFRALWKFPANKSPYATVIGYHTMAGAAYGGKRYTANQVVFKDNTLFVSSGEGGVHIYDLEALAKSAMK